MRKINQPTRSDIDETINRSGHESILYIQAED